MEKRSPLNTSLNSLLVFHEVAKFRSFSRAAEELFISQPAVSKHIRELEQKIGMGLIRRGRGGFYLTEAGGVLFKHTHRISSHLLEIENALGILKKDHHGVLKIGTTESYAKCLMPKLLSGFQASYPSIKFTLEVGNSEEIEKSVLDYKNDLGLIGAVKASSKFELVPFLREELVLIVSPDHPLTKRKAVSLKEIREYPFIIRAKGSTTRRILFHAFEEHDIHPSLMIEAGSSEFIKQWVSEGKGVSVIVRRLGEDEEKRGMIKMIRLLEKLHLEVAVLYLKEERANPVIKAFIRYMENKRRDFSQV
ncbi:MAG TPA: LysR family transcriptional regulator [Thermodesulfobacteriota bacterium]|nr:LysR family transcriptional regulator [Thermodesulfobacteriota bacterium]